MGTLMFPLNCHAQQSKEQLAAQFFNNGNYEQAIEMYEALYKRTTNKYYYQMLLRSYLSLEDYKSAERIAEKQLKSTPKDLTIYVDLGDVYTRKGDLKKADKTFLSAIDRLGYDSRQLSQLVMAFDAINRSDYSIKAYQSMRQKQNSKIAYVMELATLFERTGQYEKMMQEYFELMDAAPGNIGSIQISLQRALSQTSNPKLADGLRKALVSRIQQDPGNRQYLEMMIWFSLQQQDFQFALTQAKSVDSRFPDQGGEQILHVSEIARSNGDFATAIQGYALLVKKGPQSPYYYAARVGALQSEFDQLNRNYPITPGKLSSLRQSYQAAFDELGKTIQTIPLMRNYASLMAYYADDVQSAADILYDILELPAVPKAVLSEVKLELGDVLLFAGEIWEASLLYMQVEKANKEDVLGAMAKFKNAKLSYYNNDFLWAKSQLDVLRASTSKLIANDAMELSLLISDNMDEDSTFDMLQLYASADMMLYRNQLDAAWDAFDDISHRALSHPLFDEVLLQKAKIRIRQSRYAEADTLLQQLIDFYPDDILADDALMLLAQLNEDQLNNLDRARSCYEKLILDYPVSLYVEEARKHYNKLK